MNDGLRNEARGRIHEVLRRFPKVERGVLFGSRAMGVFRPSSDIDLALEGTAIGLPDLVAIMAEIEKLNLPVDIDLVIRHRIKNPAVEEHIRRHGMEWYRREPAVAVSREKNVALPPR